MQILKNGEITFFSGKTKDTANSGFIGADAKAGFWWGVTTNNTDHKSFGIRIEKK